MKRKKRFPLLETGILVFTFILTYNQFGVFGDYAKLLTGWFDSNEKTEEIPLIANLNDLYNISELGDENIAIDSTIISVSNKGGYYDFIAVADLGENVNTRINIRSYNREDYLYLKDTSDKLRLYIKPESYKIAEEDVNIACIEDEYIPVKRIFVDIEGYLEGFDNIPKI